MYDNNNQNNIEWYRSRLGNITGSAVGNIMGTPRSKSEEWTTTAQSYLNVIAFERTLNPIVVQNDDLFSEYLSITEVHSKILDWGHKMEGEAAHLFAKTYNKKYGDGSNTPIELDEPPSVKSDSLPNFSSSPDRMYYDNEAKAFYAIEIKCPLAQNFIKFVKNVFTQDTYEEKLAGLKKAEANYYWQCFAHMAVTGATKTYFVVYNPFMRKPLYSLEIVRDEDVIRELNDKVIKADKYVCSLVDKIMNAN